MAAPRRLLQGTVEGVVGRGAAILKAVSEEKIPLQPVRGGRRAGGGGGGSGDGSRRPGTAACACGGGVLAPHSGHCPRRHDGRSGSCRSAAAPPSCPASRSPVTGSCVRCSLTELPQAAIAGALGPSRPSGPFPRAGSHFRVVLTDGRPGMWTHKRKRNPKTFLNFYHIEVTRDC